MIKRVVWFTWDARGCFLDASLNAQIAFYFGVISVLYWSIVLETKLISGYWQWLLF